MRKVFNDPVSEPDESKASEKNGGDGGKKVAGFSEKDRGDGGKKVAEFSGKLLESVGKTAADATEKAADIAVKAKNSVTDTLDVTGDGEIDIEDIIVMGLRVPGIRVNRGHFLRAEFAKRYPQEVIEDAVAFNPAHAGIPQEDIDKIADSVIRFERNCVSGISAALGIPGGMAMAATIPADIAQYYGYMLRAAQKLMYLYGFPEINVEERGQKFDSETINILTLCLGTMYGVAKAGKAIRKIAEAFAGGMEKKLLRMALTKGTLYPIVKSVSKWFGMRMTKQVFAGFFKKAIPVVGGVVGGAVTFASFKPCCDKLKASLRNTMLSNPNCSASQEDEILILDEVEDTSVEE